MTVHCSVMILLHTAEYTCRSSYISLEDYICWNYQLSVDAKIRW